MKRLLILLALVSLPALGAPSVVSGVLTAGVSQCGVFLDSNAKVTIPVTAVTTPTPGNICQFDVSTVSPGSHTISMTAITASDPIWGSQESAKSSPLAFTRPAAPTAPTNLQLTP
jgi:hypothetical protein